MPGRDPAGRLILLEPTVEKTVTTRSSLCRFTLRDEHLVADSLVKAELSAAFGENRCFEFYPVRPLVDRIRSGIPDADLAGDIAAVRASIFDAMAKDDRP